jgi:hypothetical protein
MKSTAKPRLKIQLGWHSQFSWSSFRVFSAVLRTKEAAVRTLGG